MTDDIKPPFDFLDLRAVTLDSNVCETHVRVWDNYGGQHSWVKMGRTDIQKNGDSWTLKAHLRDDYYDETHDRAYAFNIVLIGVTLDFVHNGVSLFHGWIRPNAPEHFHVPEANHDFASEGRSCDCKEYVAGPHRVNVNFTPKPNIGLYRRISGCKVSITIGPPQ